MASACFSRIPEPGESTTVKVSTSTPLVLEPPGRLQCRSRSLWIPRRGDIRNSIDQFAETAFCALQMSNTAWFLRDLNAKLVAHAYVYSGGVQQDLGLYGILIIRTPAEDYVAVPGEVPHRAHQWRPLGWARILDTSTVRMIRTAYVTADHSASMMRSGDSCGSHNDIDGRPLWASW